MTIYTIGFAGKTARNFFEPLRSVHAGYLLDVMLRNNSQLAGFTKKGNIEYFTERLTGLVYEKLPILAPEEDMFMQYRSDKDWSIYEARYLQLMMDRNILTEIDHSLLEDDAVLLCTEPTAERCHRRLAAEYLRNGLPSNISIIHL